MKRIAGLSVFLFAAFMLFTAPARGEVSDRIDFSLMTRVESHSSISDPDGNFSGETFGYFMVAAYGRIKKSSFGSAFYLNRYSFDDSEFATHIIGMNFMHAFNEKVIGSLGYTHTTDPSRGVIIVRPSVDRDRLAASVIYNFNKYDKKRTQFVSATSFSTVTDFGEQQTMSQKFEAKFPDVMRRTTGNLAYSYTYSLKETEQLTNQFSGSLSYSLNQDMKLSVGLIYVDNVYTNNEGDDTIFRTSLSYSAK